MGGQCPQCGGRTRTELARGFFQCRSPVIGAVVPPGVPGNPTTASIPISRMCGHKYQQGASSAETGELCGCGMFAVGRCSHCGAWRCGVHGSQHRGAFVCAGHVLRWPAEAEQAKQYALEQRRALYTQWRDSVRDSARELAAAHGIDLSQPVPAVVLARALGVLLGDQAHVLTVRRPGPPTGRLRRKPGPSVTHRTEAWVFDVGDRYVDGGKAEGFSQGLTLLVTREGELHLRGYHTPPRGDEFWPPAGQVTKRTIDEGRSLTLSGICLSLDLDQIRLDSLHLWTRLDGDEVAPAWAEFVLIAVAQLHAPPRP